ncbi:probable disease resistance protein At4g27220 [Rhododendron vialii]|uniref:probable disease resistance protein At4g27220 n=1 Tax=Rhododendron vialii TaxID=182163 RepID=UPI00265E83CB|nr:probable disease resistance protein At4g27220 [Rhododendron vialii]
MDFLSQKYLFTDGGAVNSLFAAPTNHNRPKVPFEVTEYKGNMKTAPEWFGDRSLLDAVLKILGRRARSTNLKKSTFRRILGHVRKTSGGKVGIYGVDGIGKTTVLKALIGCPEIKSSFDTVIYVSISRYWSRRKLLNDIARQLSLDLLNSETDDEVAEKLLESLQSRKFLLLLDDVFEYIDLEAVGVPSKDMKTGSKIVLAAQEVDVCSIMGVSKAIKIANLSSEEAWALFRDQVGGVVDSTNIQPIAQAIVNECHGIPLNLIATGKALRNVNNAIIWKLTLHDFQSIGGNDSENTLRLLKFSYDRLNGPVTKSCFLFSALYQEGHEIKVSELIQHWIQERLITGHLADVNKKGQKIVKDLVGASLLESSSDGVFVKMHQVIRDLALSIISTKPENFQFLAKTCLRATSEGNEQVLMRQGIVLSRSFAGLKEAPEEKEWKGIEMVFLMGNCISRLPEN